MEVGPCGHVAGQPARLQDGGGPKLHGPFRGFLLVPGDSSAAGDTIAARPGVDARAEIRSGLRVEARTQDDAHAGLQLYGLYGFDDVGTGGPYDNAKPECLTCILSYEETCLFEYEFLEESQLHKIRDRPRPGLSSQLLPAYFNMRSILMYQLALAPSGLTLILNSLNFNSLS